jgi:menaquinone-dependent protoporphyrinogen oxidase
VGAGHHVLVCSATEAALPCPGAFDGALLAGSLHRGHYQQALITYAREHHVVLNAMPTAFVSVSLSAAGDDIHDQAGLQDCARRLEHETHWRPGAIHQAAGGMPFTAYGLLTKLMMWRIARRRGIKVHTSQDYSYTNYEALGAVVDGWAATTLASIPVEPLAVAEGSST